MSLLFPVHRPRAGLSFTERGIALVELRGGWDKPGIVRINERTLPEGVLALSSSEPNVKDRDALDKELRALMATSSERTLAVCLPDRICHLAVFPFETLPPRERDRDPILRWRFQHEEHVAVGDARIFHRVFPMKSAMANTMPGTQSGSQVTAYVLAMAIKRSILEQYEQVCLQAGLLPYSISCAALWLYDFYRPVMTQVEQLFFVHRALDSMTCFAFWQGVPVFCRLKGLRGEQADVMREIWSTVQFYEDLHLLGGTGSGSGSVPIYMVGEGCSQLREATSQAAMPGKVTAEKQASLMPQPIVPEWKSLVSTQGRTVSTAEGLNALACAVGR